MEFEFHGTFWVEPEELRQMYKRVKNGENFDIVYDNISSCWDDCIVSVSDYIKDDVKEEIMRRIAQTNYNKDFMCT